MKNHDHEKKQHYEGTVVGKFEGEREITLGFADLLGDGCRFEDLS